MMEKEIDTVAKVGRKYKKNSKVGNLFSDFQETLCSQTR